MVKAVLAKGIYVKRALVWLFVAFVCAVAFGKMVQLTYGGFASGEDIFIPGVAVLMIAVLLVFIMSARFAMKNFKALSEGGGEQVKRN
jgi:hypothetical protein